MPVENAKKLPSRGLAIASGSVLGLMASIQTEKVFMFVSVFIYFQVIQPPVH